MSSTNQHIILKIDVVGGSTVGKTSLLGHYVHNTFEVMTTPTEGVNYQRKLMVPRGTTSRISGKSVVEGPVNSTVVLQFRDYSSANTFQRRNSNNAVANQSLTMRRLRVSAPSTMLKDAAAALIVVDEAVGASFARAAAWCECLRETSGRSGRDRGAEGEDTLSGASSLNIIPCVLLVNKHDLIESGAATAAFCEHQIEKFSQENGFVAWYYTSAATGLNIAAAVEHIVTEALRQPLPSSMSAATTPRIGTAPTPTTADSVSSFPVIETQMDSQTGPSEPPQHAVTTDASVRTSAVSATPAEGLPLPQTAETQTASMTAPLKVSPECTASPPPQVKGTPLKVSLECTASPPSQLEGTPLRQADVSPTTASPQQPLTEPRAVHKSTVASLPVIKKNLPPTTSHASEKVAPRRCCFH